MLAKKNVIFQQLKKITRVVAVLMLIGTLGAIIFQVALTAMNYNNEIPIGISNRYFFIIWFLVMIFNLIHQSNSS